MAKVTVVGEAIVFTSSLKLDDIKAVEKYRPEELTLWGGDNNEEPVFVVASTRNPGGSLNQYGAEFGAVARDGSGAATITITGVGAEDVKGYIADEYGPALIKLAKLEERLPIVLAEIERERAAIIAGITVQ